MRFLKQSTAGDIVIGPVVSTTDYSRKTDLAYNAAGISCKAFKNGTEGAVTLANSAGNGYFRAEGATAHGYYLLTLSTANTDTAGRLRITLDSTGYTAPPLDFTVLPANSFDSIVAGTDYLDANVVQIEGATTKVGYIDASINAVKSKTDSLTFTTPGKVDATADATITPEAAAAIADEVCNSADRTLRVKQLWAGDSAGTAGLRIDGPFDETIPGFRSLEGYNGDAGFTVDFCESIYSVRALYDAFGQHPDQVQAFVDYMKAAVWSDDDSYAEGTKGYIPDKVDDAIAAADAAKASADLANRIAPDNAGIAAAATQASVDALGTPLQDADYVAPDNAGIAAIPNAVWTAAERTLTSVDPDGWTILTEATLDDSGNALGPVEVGDVPTAGVQVAAYVDDGLINLTYTEGDGGFRLPVPPATTYTIIYSYSGCPSEERTVTVP